MIDHYLAHARPEAVGDLKALICPHAGYQFSGPMNTMLPITVVLGI